MAEIPPLTPGTPTGGALPPMKKETGKVQPKKETVRINLPPKPTAAPTIKLPTLPPGGPTGAPGAMPAPGVVSAAAPAAPLRSTAAPIAQASKPGAAPAAARPAAVVIPRPAAAAPTIGGLDKALAIAAAIVALVAVGTTVWMWVMLNGATAAQ
jgi:hypothetical protein